MLITLNPGLKCKKCDERITMGKDRPSDINLVLREGFDTINGDFACIMTCNHCTTEHLCKGFIRNNIFRGVFEYEVLQ